MANPKRILYVSSTFEDLKDHRAAVKAELERAGYDVESMERYAAFPEPPLDRCLADVAGCDGYVLVLAHRYGFRPKDAEGPPGRSITHREYEQAVACGKPVFAFCVDEGAPWPPPLVDKGRAAKELAAFRRHVETSHGRRLFTTPDNLAKQVLSALSSHAWQDVPSKLAPLAEVSYRWPAPWDFEPFLRDKRRAFEGREWLFDEIDAWLVSPTSGALLIRADFGVGKSALLAEIVGRYRGGKVLAWHFCQHDAQQTLQPDTFVASVAARLAEALPAYRRIVEGDPALQERLDRATADPGSAFDAAVLAPLARLPAPEGPRLLVVDALDEALELNAADARRSGTLVKLLADKATRFPSWLRVLATSRSNPDVVTPLRHAFELKEIDAERQDNVEDLRRYVLSRTTGSGLAARLQGSGHMAASLADLLVDRSAGKFLFVVRALDGLERGALAIDELAALPPGMDAFYRDAFERRFDRAGRDYAATRDLLGVMCAAREPLSRPELAEVLGVGESAVQELHRALPDFLHLRAGRLGFDHFSLAEWLTREDEQGFQRAGGFAVEPASARARLRAWALAHVQAGTSHDSHYLLRHLAAHLADDGEREAVYARLLLERFDWSQARLEASGVEALLTDTEHLQGHAEQGWLQAVVRNSAHALRQAPGQWAARVLGLVGRGLGPQARLQGLARATRQWLASDAGRPVAQRLLVPLGRSLRLAAAQEAVYEGGIDLAVLPDGRIASGSTDGTVRLWDPSRPGEILVFEGHADRVNALAVLPDGHIALGLGDGTVRVWNPSRLGEAVVFEGHEDVVTTLAVLPDGRIASGSNDRTVRLWNPSRPGETVVFEGHEGWITVLAVLLDGRIASGSTDGTVRLWNPSRPGEVLVFEGHAGGVNTLAVLPDGGIASGWDDHTVRLWNPSRPSEAVVLEGHADWVRALAVLPDGRIASGSNDRTVRLWNPSCPGEAIVFEGHADGVATLAVLPDGRIASGSDDRTVRLWNPSHLSEALVFEGHADRVNALAVLPDRRIASSANDGTVRLWNLSRPREAVVFEGHAGKVWALAVLPDGRIASGSTDRTVRLWNPSYPDEAVVFEGHADIVRALAVLPDGRIASGSTDCTVRLWNPSRPGEAVVFERHADGVLALAVLPNGRIASASDVEDSTVRLWNPSRPGEAAVFKGHETGITTLAVLLDGRIASGSTDGTVRLWNPSRPGEVLVFEGHAGVVNTLAVLPDRRIASGSTDHTVRLWNPSRPDEAVVFGGHADWVRALAVLPDGRIASGSNDRTVRLWNPSRPDEAVVFEGHADIVRALAVLPDGRIASGSNDHTVRIWDEPTRRTARLFVTDANVTCLAVSRTGIIAAGCLDGAVHLLCEGDSYR